MNRLSKVFIAILAGILILIVALFILDIGRSSIYASPEDVFNAAKRAAGQGDLRTLSECLTEDSRDLILAHKVVNVMAIKAAPAQMINNELKAIASASSAVLVRHGLTDDFLADKQGAIKVFDDDRTPLENQLQVAHVLLQPVSDRNALFEELHKAQSAGSNRAGPFAQWRDASLSDVRVVGSEAQGKVAFKDQGEGRAQDLFFRKVRESWRMDFFPVEKKQKPPGHP